MSSKTSTLIEVWKESRKRFSNELAEITEQDLLKRTSPKTNSIGFLIRHIADVELLFAKNVFNAERVKIIAKTVIAKKDSGEWTNREDLISHIEYAANSLENIIALQLDQDWDAMVTTKEFGTKTKAEALGRIISHTAYHTGQIAAIKKYGSVFLTDNFKKTTEISRATAQSIGNEIGINWQEVNLDEFYIGINVELEHGYRYPETNVTNDNLVMTAKIAWAHLLEFSDYYTRLEKMEEEAELYWKQRKIFVKKNK